MSKKVLITGASGGFGKLTTQALLNKGHSVVASMRNPDGKNSSVAAELKAAGAQVVDIDVTNTESVNKGVEKAIVLADGLDVVVNNAGVGVLGLQESFTPEDFQELFEINVIGVQRVNRAALPHLRSKNSGLLVHISSLLGRFSLPFYGPYNATKWALEAYAENYRVELSGLGIDVCIVEPGGFPTTFMDNLVKPADPSRDEGYGDFAKVPEMMFENFENALRSNPEQKPENVANTVVDLIEQSAGSRKFRTVVDKMGMGDPMVAYNDHLEQIMNAVYGNFKMGDLLKVKT